MVTIAKTRTGAAILIVLFGTVLWQIIKVVPFLAGWNYLNDQFYVFWHEGSHALATVLTGGSVLEMFVDKNLGGHVMSFSGFYALISPAGYLGSTAIGCSIIYLLVRYPRRADFWAFFFGLAAMLIGAIFTSIHPELRILSISAVLCFVGMFLFAKKHRRILTIAGFIGTLAITAYLWSTYLAQVEGNLTLLVGVAAGGLLVIVGASGNELASMILTAIIASDLTYNAVTRGYQMIEEVKAGGINDPAMFAKSIDWNPLLVSWIWVIIIGMMVAFTAYSIYKIEKTRQS